MGKGIDLVSSARMSMRRMTSEVLVPSFANNLAVRSFKSAGTRTWIKLLDFLVVAILFIVLLYDNVIQKSMETRGKDVV